MYTMHLYRLIFTGFLLGQTTMVYGYDATSGLTCFQCVTTDISLCDKVTQCFTYQACYFHETVNYDNKIWYTLGCNPEQTCREINNPTHCHTVQRSTDSICTRRFHCCKENFCNKNFTMEMPTVFPSNSPSRTRATTSVSEQTTTTLVTVGTTDIETTTGATTGLKTMECNECYYVDNPLQCENTKICGEHMMCYSMRVINDAFNSGRCFYKLGCMRNSTCEFYKQKVGNGSLFHTTYGDTIDHVTCCNHIHCNRHQDNHPASYCIKET